MDDKSRRQPLMNPFSPTAVAKVSESTGMISVETQSAIEALRYLDAYLQPPGEPGYAIAIQGDYGSGKTHLAAMLLNRVREWAEQDPARHSARPVYLDAADHFRDLYARFVKVLPESEVYAKVRGYYADTLAEQLGADEVSARIRTQLRSPEADLEEIISALGLSEYGLIGMLRDKLADVTDDESFATVLSLLVRPGFRQPAWQWLTGGPPNALLTERGVTRTIVATEASAIDAFGVFAKLYGHRGDRFVLVIDELGKLIPSPQQGSSPAELSAFQHLLESFESAKAMLVLVGLKESLDLIVGGPRERVSAFITMSPFDPNTARQFIELSLDRVRDWKAGDRLYPFTPEAVQEIVDLTYGNPRRIGLYCRRLFSDSIQQDAKPQAITAADVRRMAKSEQFGAEKRRQVTTAIQATLEAQHWDYHRDYFVSAEPGSKADYWIPAGESGCALLLADSVTEPADVERLTSRAQFIRQRSRCEMLLVVSEALAPEYRNALTEAFGREPLIYQPNSFVEELASLTKALRYRLSQVAGGDALAELRDKVDWLTGNQPRMHDVVEHVMAGLQALQASSERGIGDVRRNLDRMAASVTALTRQVSHASDPDLPSEVAAVFDERLNALSALEIMPELVDKLFNQQAEAEPATRDTLASIRAATRLDRDRSTTSALGVAATLRNLTTSFRRSIDEWFHTSAPPNAEGRLPAAALEKLDALCEAYDAVYEYLPTFELDYLHTLSDPDGPVPRAERLRTLRGKFDTLAADVRQAVIGLFPL